MSLIKRFQRPLLLPFSFIYGLIVLVRNFFFDIKVLKSVRFDFPVISVGNITVGGTGKTPHVEYLTRLLKNDFKIAILSRGYKRKTIGFILSSENSTISDIGDEAYQIKQKFRDVSIAVDSYRVNGVRNLKKLIPELNLVILDDAFQHRYIKPSCSIVLIDYTRPVFDDFLLPAGNLREMCSSLNRADIIIVTKCTEITDYNTKQLFLSKLNLKNKQKVFFTKYEYGLPVPVFEKDYYDHYISNKQAEIILVTGIANPKPLEQHLTTKVNIKTIMTFPDHHNFTKPDLKKIMSNFQSIHSETKYIITTEKDAVKLRNMEIDDPVIKKSFFYIPINTVFLENSEPQFLKEIKRYLNN